MTFSFIARSAASRFMVPTRTGVARSMTFPSRCQIVSPSIRWLSGPNRPSIFERDSSIARYRAVRSGWVSLNKAVRRGLEWSQSSRYRTPADSEFIGQTYHQPTDLVAGEAGSPLASLLDELAASANDADKPVPDTHCHRISVIN